MNDLYHMIDVWVCGIAAYVQQIEMLFMIIHGLRNKHSVYMYQVSTIMSASWHNNWCTQIYGKEITIYSIIDLVGRSIVFMYRFDMYIPLSSRTI